MPSQKPSTLAIGKAVLTVNDLDLVADFYEKTIGLQRLSRDGESALLGAGTDGFLELRRDVSARRRATREAGLFHIAFLLPAREDLGRWVKHVSHIRAPVTGMADHAVSEAFYLSDPEGNGVEIYVDRPAASWLWQDGVVKMVNDPVDVEGLYASAGDSLWQGAPAGTRIGHMHLQVGAIEPAEHFYRDILGLDVTSRYPGATFYAADGYHHHIATNIWNSRGAGPRDFPSTGLAEFEVRVDPARAETLRGRAGMREDAFRIDDPWRTPIVVTPVADPGT